MAQENYKELLSLKCLNSEQEIDSTDLLGKLVVIYSFRETNILSLCYLEKLKTWADHYKQHLVVVGLFSPKYEGEEEEDYVRSLIARYDIRFPVFNDPDNFFRKIYGLKAEPGIVLFDQLGRRRSIGFGNFDLKAVHDMALNLMNQGIQAKVTRSTNSILIKKPEDLGGFLWGPTALAYDKANEVAYVCDSFHHRIIATKIDGRVDSTIGKGEPGDQAGDTRDCKFRYPRSILVDGEDLYIADTGNHKIKKMNITSGKVVDLIGTGQLNFHQNVNHRGKRMSLAYPTGLSIQWIEERKYLVFSNAGSRNILKYDLEKDEVTNFIGTGVDKILDDHYESSCFHQPTNINNQLPSFNFILDSDHSALRLAHNDYVKTLVGNKEGEFGSVDGPAKSARLTYPTGLAWDGKDLLLLTEYFGGKLRMYSISQKKLSSFTLALPETARVGDIISVGSDKFLITDTYNNKLYTFDSSDTSLSAVDLRFHSSSQEEIKEKVEKLPDRKFMIEEIKVERKSLLSLSIDIEIELPDSYTINEEANNTLFAFEKHITHWYLVRRLDLSNQSRKLIIKLRNVARTSHYVIDLKLSICREGMTYESKESCYRLHIEESDSASAKDVQWKIKVKA